MTRRILLVRHTQVALRWHGRCYGSSDMGLSRAGQRHATVLAATLATLPITAIVHSGLIRTRILADRVAHATGLLATIDPRWRERDFGGWEGRGWNAIWRETGSAMDGLMTDPAGFRPGGDGETGQRLADRATAALAALPSAGTILVVSHGGPIASLRARAAGRPLTDAAGFIPAQGEIVPL